MEVKPTLRLLLVEDEDDHADLLRSLLGRRERGKPRFEIERANSMKEGLEWLERSDYDIVLLDLSLPDSIPHSTLRTFTAKFPDVPVVILTSLEDESLSLTAIEGGAQDFLDKSRLDRDLILRSIHYAIERKLILTRLEIQNEELKRFAHTVAHEFKSPLQSIVTAFCILQESQDKLDVTLNKLVALGVQSSDRLNAMVNGLLDFAETKGDEALGEIVDFNDLAREILETPQMALDLAPYEVQLANSLPVVKGARLQLRQVLQNLISNAIKYRKGDDLVIQIGAEKEGEMWVFHVRDNGRGIAAEHIDKVFEPFFRVYPRDEIPGTGIGLGFCMGVIERHGGEMWVESELGEGSTFYFTLPTGIAAAA